MRDEELLLSISKLLDDKINPLEKRMDSMEQDLKKEIGIVRDEVNLVKDHVELVENEVKLMENHVKLVESQVHHINLKLENVFEPRMNTIEACYLDTFKRYQRGCDKIDKLESDNELIRSILQKHSKIRNVSEPFSSLFSLHNQFHLVENP